MPKIRYLKIRFENDLHPCEIPGFRAAVIEQTRREAPLFHNHAGDDGFIYQYPLIQYKVTRRKASVVCINEGTDEIHTLLKHRRLHFRIGAREEDYRIEDVNLHYFNVQTWQRPFPYRIHNWLALNQKNFHEYLDLGSDAEKLAFLERILTGNILAFAKGIDWQVEDQITVRIPELPAAKSLKFKGLPMMGFTMNFHANVSLPHFIGLGKGSSLGFGVVSGSGRSGSSSSSSSE